MRVSPNGVFKIQVITSLKYNQLTMRVFTGLMREVRIRTNKMLVK